ncbi:hypothetical protein [Streptomyces sp. NRRL F-5123]|uniref:hypothetical protein n=1 Tax=Streptomyces sp. NRRL F-5123 TaxID=1463856 RepID=UPI000ACF5C56|nr:hypothetical protein [Streptomyces sp. NRRL F-5123]
MPLHPDQRFDPATGVVLAAEAALLEARLRMLREALGSVDARIAAVTEALRRLDR